MSNLKKGITALLIMAITLPAYGQSLEESLGSFLEDNATSYIQPLVTGFGTSMNSGLYRQATTKTGLIPPFGIDFGIVVSIAEVSETDMNFAFDLSENYIVLNLNDINSALPNEEVTLSFDEIYSPNKETTPTIAGDEDGVMLYTKSGAELYTALYNKVSDSNKPMMALIRTSIENELPNLIQDFQFPNGLNLPYMGVPLAQANIRLPFKLELSVRGVPTVDVPDVGTLEMYGGGIRWGGLPVPIVDVTLGAYYQMMNFGDVFSATNMNVHAEVGKKLGALGFYISPYAGIGYDMTNVSLAYTFDPDGTPDSGDEVPMDFSFEGDNGVRMTAGLSLQIPLIYLNAEVSQGTYNSYSLGAGFVFK